METERLTLRPLQKSDFEDFFAYAMDSELCRMYGLPVDKEKDVVYQIFSSFLFGGKTLALVFKSTQKMVGHIIIVPPEFPEQELLKDKAGVTLAFAISPAYQRQGLMFEALSEVTYHLFCRQNVDYIHCGYYDYNIPSKRLQEKLGFQYFGSHTVRNGELTIIDNLMFKKQEDTI